MRQCTLKRGGGDFVPSVAGTSEPATLDFNNLVAAISVIANATLALTNLKIVNVSSHHAADDASFPYTKARELQIWPSIILEGGSTVCLLSIFQSAQPS